MHVDPEGPYLALTPSEARLVRAAILASKEAYLGSDREFYLRTGEDRGAVTDLLGEVDRHEALWRAE
jgi:hypothetical protein